MRALILSALTLTVLTPSHLPAQAAGDENAGGNGAGPATQNSGADFVLPRVTWRTRNVIANDRLMHWRAGIAGDAFGKITLTEAAGRTDALSLNFVEGSADQKASPDLQKNVDPKLTAEERTALKNGLRNVKLLAYRTDRPGADETARRQLFEFAKALGIEFLIVPLDAATVSDLDKLAGEFNVNVALTGAPREVGKALEGRSKRMGAAADTGAWLEQGIRCEEALSVLKDKITYVSLRDRSAAGSGGRDAVLGEGAGSLKVFLRDINRPGNRPLVLMIARTEAARSFGQVAKNVEAFEAVVQPALGEFVTSASREFPIRGLQNLPADKRKAIEESGTNYIMGHRMLNQMNVNLSAEVRQKIDAALPESAPAKPKKPRKLLVIDACVANMSHNVIPHANYAIERMGQKTGAYEAIFSNDFNRLKYPAIKEYDAIFLNSTVGELFPDPEVREGLTRFVREGGGLGALHGATYASRNWPEFAEMVGAADGPHRVQPATLKIEHPESPLTKSFGNNFRYSDEYYRFYDTGPTAWLTREKVHVLLSIDLDKTPDFNQGRPPYIRKDNDYPIAWIKSYGKGRVFNNAMGHTPELFMTPELSRHILAAIQFILGDLDDDLTPSAKLASRNQ